MKQDLPNAVFVGLIYEYKIIEIIIKKNFFPAGWLVGVDSQQTTRATSTSGMPLRSKQLPLKYNQIKQRFLPCYVSSSYSFDSTH